MKGYVQWDGKGETIYFLLALVRPRNLGWYSRRKEFAQKKKKSLFPLQINRILCQSIIFHVLIY